MGRYVLDVNKAAQLRPVYKKTDGDDYIFYTGKLWLYKIPLHWRISIAFGPNQSGELYLYSIYIVGFGKWVVHSVITGTSGWISTEKRGLQTIPTSGWKYWDSSTRTWKADPDLKFIFNLNI